MYQFAFTSVDDPNLALALKILPALIVVLVASAVCGRLAIAVKQPRVLGEMVAGVLLGPTFLGMLLPDIQQRLFPAEVKSFLYVLSTIGLTLYMFLVGVGMEHGERGEAKKTGRQATVLAMSGVLPALVLGAGAGVLWYDELSRGDISRAEFAFFVGSALSITAFPMLARILYERGLQHSRLGKLSLVAASMDDAAAWCLLAVLSAVHAGTGLTGALRTIVLVAIFAALMLLVVARLLRPLGATVARTGRLAPGQMYLVAVIVLTAGWFTDFIGVYSVFGGFIAGLAMPRNAAFREALHGRMMDFVCVFLLPVFFAFSGLNTKLGGVTDGTMLLALGTLLAAGFAGKYVGCGLTMRAVGYSWRESWAVGGLMNARGLMILIFINIGLAQKMITQELFSMLVLVAVITTAGAVPLFRWALPPRHEARLLPPVPVGTEMDTTGPAPRDAADVPAETRR
ncbi:cation:proton antiporter [Streptomyces sp. NPDC054796]